MFLISEVFALFPQSGTKPVEFMIVTLIFQGLRQEPAFSQKTNPANHSL